MGEGVVLTVVVDSQKIVKHSLRGLQCNANLKRPVLHSTLSMLLLYSPWIGCDAIFEL